MATVTAAAVNRALSAHASRKRKEANERFFKTGPGEYGEGDQFIGVSMPDTRKVAKQFRHLCFDEIAKLLESPIHEHRMCGLLILVYRYEGLAKQHRATSTGVAQVHGRELVLHPERVEVRGVAVDGASSGSDLQAEHKAIVDFYLKHIDRVNNWDLVDCSAPQILGQYYRTYGGEAKLYTLAKSRSLWRRRIAIVSTFAFIRAGELTHTLAIAELLMNDTEDLIHKATGWMLREVGKQDKRVLEQFLHAHAAHMPRTCLRYAIERFPEGERKGWMGVVA